MLGERMGRRKLLRKLAALGAGLAFAGPILAACGPAPAAAPAPEPVAQLVTVIKEIIVERQTR